MHETTRSAREISLASLANEWKAIENSPRMELLRLETPKRSPNIQLQARSSFMTRTGETSPIHYAT